MGASGWDYIETYRGSLQATLDALRQRAFEEDDYHWPDGGPKPPTLADLMSVFAIDEPSPDCDDESHQDAFDFATLMAQSGFQSILDVATVAAGPIGSGTIRPLTDAEALSDFGTERPTRADYDRVGSARDQGDYERWEGRCVALHDADGTIAEVAFWGCSGD